MAVKVNVYMTSEYSLIKFNIDFNFRHVQRCNGRICINTTLNFPTVEIRKRVLSSQIANIQQDVCKSAEYHNDCINIFIEVYY